MKVEDEEPEVNAANKKGSRSVARADLAVPLLIFSGLGAAFVSGISVATMAFNPNAHSAHFLFGYWPGLLFFPCFLVALFRFRWASIPFWVCCVSLFVMGLLRSRHPAEEVGTFQPGIGILLMPALAEIARLIRRRQSKLEP